jgi:uncharacterized protein YeaO (DUF488 family)
MEDAMPLHLSTFRCGSPRKEGEGLRIGTFRYLPRGVRKEDYAKKDYFDVWLPTVAPSRETLRSFKSKGIDEKTWGQLVQRYTSEMRKSTESRQTILLLAEMAKETPIAVGCYCADENFCHRSVLKRLIEEAAEGRFPPNR